VPGIDLPSFPECQDIIFALLFLDLKDKLVLGVGMSRAGELVKAGDDCLIGLPLGDTDDQRVRLRRDQRSADFYFFGRAFLFILDLVIASNVPETLNFFAVFDELI
jgi:hypothetical protein